MLIYNRSAKAFHNNAVLTEAGLIVAVGVREVKVAMEFSIVELYGNGVVRILVHSPSEANEI